MNKIVLRPSSIAGHFGCSLKWFNDNIENKRFTTGSSTEIGSAIHKVAEEFWNTLIKQGKAGQMYTEELDSQYRQYLIGIALKHLEFVLSDAKIKLKFAPKETKETCINKINRGVNIFLDKIARKVPIPYQMETRYTIKQDHPMIDKLSGTIDIIGKQEGEHYIADIKTTSKDRPVHKYEIQLGIYKYLLQNGFYEGTEAENYIEKVEAKKCWIYLINVAEKPAKCRATGVIKDHKIEECLIDNFQTIECIDTMIKKLRLYYGDNTLKSILFTGNSEHYLCSDLWCDSYRTCAYVNKRRMIMKQEETRKAVGLAQFPDD